MKAQRKDTMKILGVATREHEIQVVETQLKETGLYSRYEGQIKGQQKVLIIVRVRDIQEKEKVKEIFERAGVTEITYREDEIAAGF